LFHTERNSGFSVLVNHGIPQVMNAPFRLDGKPERVLLCTEQFWQLKQEGAFKDYAKAELLNGELWGVLRQEGDEPESDATFPIKLRVPDYERLDAIGAFADIGKTELIDGVVYRMSPQFRPHGFAKDELAYRLRRALEQLGSSLHVATEQSVDLGPHSEPQPDIVLTSEPQGEGAIPGSSIALIVEISGTTLAFDLAEKALTYAAAGILEYWVVDLKGKTLHLHAEPGPSGYPKPHQIAFGARVASATLAGLSVETTGLV
jgi:Uma2 family endonuclease